MAITVAPYSPGWPVQFERVAAMLRVALRDVRIVGIEHVGSASVPGLAAKPIIDVSRAQLRPVIDALAAVGYRHRGDLGLHDRESLAEILALSDLTDHDKRAIPTSTPALTKPGPLDQQT